MDFIIAQICGVIAFMFSIISMQINDKKKILYYIVIRSVFYTANYILLGAISGSIVCGISTIETIINSILFNKGKKLPNSLIGIYMLLAGVIAIFTYNNWLDIFSMVGSFSGVMLICLKKESNIRKCNLVLQTTWTIYGIGAGAFVAAITNIIGIISTVIGIYRFDIKKEGEKVSHENDA